MRWIRNGGFLIALAAIAWAASLAIDPEPLDTFADFDPATAKSSSTSAESYTPTELAAIGPNDVVIGFDGDLSVSAQSGGESILAAMKLVAAQVNARGGLLGRKVHIVARDHLGMASRGVANLREFCGDTRTLAVFTSVHSPVALAQLEVAHEERMLLMVPWAAASPIVSNGYDPNFVFRLSVRDEFAGEFLIAKAVDTSPKVALYLENTGWGRSNEKSMRVALAKRGLQPTEVCWFNWGDTEFDQLLEQTLTGAAETIVLVANPPEGGAFIEALARAPRKVRVFSHWGITAGDFGVRYREALQDVDLCVLQTAHGDPEERQSLYDEYAAHHGRSISHDVEVAPVGFSNAYDLMQLLVNAVEQAQTFDRGRVRDALETLPPHDGLVRRYTRPFRPDWHEALGIEDFVFCSFEADGTLAPNGSHDE